MCTDDSAERRRPPGQRRLVAGRGTRRAGARLGLARLGLATLLVWMGAAAVLGGLGVDAPVPAGASGAVVTGTGSSYAAVAINQWVAQVEQLYGDNINYSTQSSVIGLNYFAQGQVDFGASEIGYSTNQANETPPAGEAYQYMPDVAGAICLMYNLVGETQQPITTLKMDPEVLFDIFTGQLRNWNAPALEALNPGVLLPNSAIVPVYRTDASGDNYIFSDYFYTLDPSAWNTFAVALGSLTGPTALWPTPQSGGNTVGPYNFSDWIGQNGSDNASNYVNGNLGSLTYVETAYAIEHHRPCVEVENQSGAYLAPSELGDAIALQTDQLAPDLEQNLTNVFESTNPAAYPISAYSYLITEEEEMPPTVGAVMGQFVKFLACKGQQAAGQLGYAPIPPNLVQDDFDAIDRMAGASAPGPVDASNCPNPYLLDPASLPQPTTYNTTPPQSGNTTTTSTTTQVTTGVTTASGSSGGGPSGTSQDRGSNGKRDTKADTKAGHVSSSIDNFDHTLPVATLRRELARQAGDAPGLALLGASNRLAQVPGPTGATLWWTAGFVGLGAAAPLVAAVRRRRRRVASGGTA